MTICCHPLITVIYMIATCPLTGLFSAMVPLLIIMRAISIMCFTRSQAHIMQASIDAVHRITLCL